MTNQSESNLLSSIVRVIANFLLPAGERDLSTVFSKQARILIVLIILTQLVIACPPFVNWIITKTPDFSLFQYFKDNWSFWNDWLPYVQLVSEILFALFIGGSIFGTWISNSSEIYVQKLQTKLDLISNDNYDEVSSRLANNYQTLETTIKGTTIKNFFTSLIQILRLTRNISNILYADFPKKITGIIAAKFMISFPGGLYGLIAFIIFWFLISLEILIIYHQKLEPVI